MVPRTTCLLPWFCFALSVVAHFCSLVSVDGDRAVGQDNFDADTFYNFYNFTTLNCAYQDKLKAGVALWRDVAAVTVLR